MEEPRDDASEAPSAGLSPGIKWLGCVITLGIVLCVAIASVGVSVGWWLHYRETLEATSPRSENLATPGPRTSDAASNSASDGETGPLPDTSGSSDSSSSTSEDEL